MLSSCFNQIPEHRQSNKITYSAHDALMSGFACMHFQDLSLLQFQKRLEKKHHKSNLQTLFDIKSIPESTQLRTIIDGVDSDYFNSFFDDYTHHLQRGKHLAQYQLLDGLYYIPDLFAQGGRCRWKLENECFNTLKNQGYVIDHSYGHGDKNLCFNFYLLTLIAFSFHQVYELTDKVY